LQVMDGHAQRDAPHRHAVADARLDLLAADDAVAGLEPLGSQDVRLFAVLVLNQGDASRALGVVLDGADVGPHAVLAAIEVDDAVHALVAAAAEARADDALVVAAALFVQRLQERFFRLALAVGQLREVADRTLAAARRRRFVLANAHDDPFQSEAVLLFVET